MTRACKKRSDVPRAAGETKDRQVPAKASAGHHAFGVAGPRGPQSSTAQPDIWRHQKLDMTPLERLTPHPNNPRRHSPAQVRQIATSITQSGWGAPVIVDEHNRIVSGHGRCLAAKSLGLSLVPTICVRGLSEAQLQVLMLAENRIGMNASFDDAQLTIIFKDLANSGLERTGVDLSDTGFSIAEIDRLLIPSTGDLDERANALPEPVPGGVCVSRPGDTFVLGTDGRHRLHHGNALQEASYDALMVGHKAQLGLTDPPYNVPMNGHARGLGRDKHREFAMASGEMSEDEFLAFLKTVLGRMRAHSQDGALHYQFMDWAHLYVLLGACREVFDELKNICIWNKANGGMGSLYRSKHECVVVSKVGHAPHINNVELGRHGRYRTNVWDYAGLNSFGTGRTADLAMHATPKPVELIADVILDASKRGGIVLDPFAGSGTIIIAAERTGRRAFAMEIDAAFVDSSIRRFQAFTGDVVIHEASGLTFDELAGRRRASGKIKDSLTGAAASKPRDRKLLRTVTKQAGR